MRHARTDALDQLEELIVELRSFAGLKEKSRGVFYRGGRSFLHFHEDPAGLFADMGVGDDFTRFRVTTRKERTAFLKAVRAVLTI